MFGLLRCADDPTGFCCHCRYSPRRLTAGSHRSHYHCHCGDLPDTRFIARGSQLIAGFGIEGQPPDGLLAQFAKTGRRCWLRHLAFVCVCKDGAEVVDHG